MVSFAKFWRTYQRWREYLARPEPPCALCQHISYDTDARYGVRCAKGDEWPKWQLSVCGHCNGPLVDSNTAVWVRSKSGTGQYLYPVHSQCIDGVLRTASPPAQCGDFSCFERYDAN